MVGGGTLKATALWAFAIAVRWRTVCLAPNSFHNLAHGINHSLRSIMLYVMPCVFNHDQLALS